MSSILILGASYGSLLATKLLMAGHDACLVCTAPTAALINREGTVVRFPVKGREGLVEIASRKLPGRLRAATPEDARPEEYDLVVLAMQEPQYGADGVRQLLARIARARIPCLAIMNMPPLPWLARLPKLDAASLADCYTDASVWQGFDPALVTLASPDPQAFRPADAARNVLQVGLPTNFKAARFAGAAPTALLRRLEADIEAARFEGLDIPVKLKVHESPFVPLAKWPMLLAGNYRCVREEGSVPIAEAVHGDIARSRAVYDWVGSLCLRLGAAPGDLVPFEKYAQAAASLRKPSSAARAIDGGAGRIERVDRLVLCIAERLGLDPAPVRETVALVDARLRANREAREEVAA